MDLYGLTFDDVLLLPGYSQFRREEISLKIKLVKTITLGIPLLSSPMDTVTEAKLAHALAKMGGIGIIHRNLPLLKQASEVSKVKRDGLLVGAAVSAGKDLEARTGALVKAGVDVLVIDSAQGFSPPVIDASRLIKKKYPRLPLIAGNIATAEGAEALIQTGADALRVGMGPGSICTTRVISGVGIPQLTAIREVCKVTKVKKIPLIADGGIKNSGDITKALAAGASAVMLGSLFASCLESPGKVVILKKAQIPSRFLSSLNGKQKTLKFKQYRGMGSIAALKNGGHSRYGQENYNGRALIGEGVEGLTPAKGKVADVVEQLMGGLRSGMYYVGAKDIPDLWRKSRFIQITPASSEESHPHNILIVDPGKNYDLHS